MENTELISIWKQQNAKIDKALAINELLLKEVINNKSFYHNDNFIYISKKLDTVEKDYNVTINYNLSVNYKDKESIDFDYNYKLDLPNSILYIKNFKKHIEVVCGV